jgi:hypothetical protein
MPWPPNFSWFLGSNSSPVTLSDSWAAEATSAPAKTEGHKYISFFIYVNDPDTATRLDVQIQVSDFGESNPDSIWAPLQTESVADGIATQSDYEVQKSGVDGVAVDPTLFLPITIPIRAFRYFRLRLKADAGSPTVHARYSLSGGGP